MDGLTHDPVREKLRALPPRDLERELWLRGDLSYLLFPGGQAALYNFVHEWKNEHGAEMGPLVLEAHRGLGKSFLLLLLAVERAFKFPDQNVRFGGPAFKQVLELNLHNFGRLMQRAPDDLIQASSERIVIRNPRWGDAKARSFVWLFGCNRESIESQRSLRSNMIVLDECRDIDQLEYVITDVLSFHTILQSDPLMVLSSTPPTSTAHPWATRYVPEARRQGRYIMVNVENNPDFQFEDEVRLLGICGTKESTAWRREALCQCVSDETQMVCPEFLKAKAKIVRHHVKPDWCYQFLGGDFGFKDSTAILFAYWDFLAAKLVVESEYVTHYKSTSQIAEAIKAKRRQLLECLPDGRPRPLAHAIRAVADATLQQLHDLSIDHGVLFEEAEKTDRWANLASMRAAIQDERILISPECRNLIFQLETGIFNKTRKEFERVTDAPAEDAPIFGHLDAVAALMYLWRLAKSYTTANPFPSEKIGGDDVWVPPGYRQEKASQIILRKEPIARSRQRLV